MAWFRTSGNNGGSLKVLTASGDIASFETNLVAPLHSLTVNVLATGGNGSPDNPNPINGYTEANITRCGVNLWDEEWELGSYSWTGAKSPDNTRIRCKNFIPCSPSTTYYVAASGNLQFFYYDENQGLITYEQSSKKNRPITTPANCAYMTFYVYSSDYGTTYKNDISILYPSDITPAYHAYTGNTYTIAFGQTVYGGVLDVTRGKLTVTHVRVTFDGTEVYQLYGATVVCNKYFTAGLGSHLDMKCSHQVNSQIGYANTDKTRFEFRNIVTSWGCADIDAFKTFIATQYANGTPIQILYPLATPFDIDLTPEVISAVVGENNVFAGCGQTTVKYLKRE